MLRSPAGTSHVVINALTSGSGVPVSGVSVSGVPVSGVPVSGVPLEQDTMANKEMTSNAFCMTQVILLRFGMFISFLYLNLNTIVTINISLFFCQVFGNYILIRVSI